MTLTGVLGDMLGHICMAFIALVIVLFCSVM